PCGREQLLDLGERSAARQSARASDDEHSPLAQRAGQLPHLAPSPPAKGNARRAEEVVAFCEKIDGRRGHAASFLTWRQWSLPSSSRLIGGRQFKLQILEADFRGVARVQLQREDAARYAGLVVEINAQLAINPGANAISHGRNLIVVPLARLDV